MEHDVGMRFGHFNLTLPFPAYFEIAAWQNLSNTSTEIVFNPCFSSVCEAEFVSCGSLDTLKQNST